MTNNIENTKRNSREDAVRNTPLDGDTSCGINNFIASIRQEGKEYHVCLADDDTLNRLYDKEWDVIPEERAPKRRVSFNKEKSNGCLTYGSLAVLERDEKWRKYYNDILHKESLDKVRISQKEHLKPQRGEHRFNPLAPFAYNK